MDGRIWFEGNPWPGGHAVREAIFAGHLSEGGVGLLLELATVDYEDEYPETFADEAFETGGALDATDWESPIVWGNFHACILSNLRWGVDARKLPQLVGRGDPGGQVLTRSHRFEVDPLEPEPEAGFDVDDNVFHIYLLGHDAVRGHRIDITPSAAAGCHEVEWTGRIALAYIGETRYEHRFRCRLRDLPFAGFMIDPAERAAGADREKRARSLAARHLPGVESLRFEQGRGAQPDWLRVVPGG
jgi:hypothetical protein